GILIAAGQGEAAKLADRASAAGVDALRIGRGGGQRLEISVAEREVSAALADAERAWHSLSQRLG
ncbi:MAG: hypothetical protein ACRDL6_12555, partial [Solirubrobacterales bacterium]